MSVVSVVCCQVEVSATSRSLVQRIPTDCCVPECGREASTMGRLQPTGTVALWEKNEVILHFLFQNLTLAGQSRNMQLTETKYCFPIICTCVWWCFFNLLTYTKTQWHFTHKKLNSNMATDVIHKTVLQGIIIGSEVAYERLHFVYFALSALMPLQPYCQFCLLTNSHCLH